MNNKLKKSVKTIKEIFSSEYIEKTSKKTKFVQRKGKLSPEDFLAFNIFSSQDMCEKSLSNLCSRLDSQFDVSVSPQALNKRYNNHSVDFMREVFNDMLTKQNTILERNRENLGLNFNRIRLNDATSFALPKEFIEEFKGSGGSAPSSTIKIQLQYELFSGSFMCCDIREGTDNDATYLNTMSEYIEPGDLKLADLGYYKASYLKEIDRKKAFYISKLKSDTRIYIRNPNPDKHKNGNIKKSTKYIKIDIQELVKPLSEGETMELKDVYIGQKKDLKSRLIVTKLTEENKRQKQIKHTKEIKKGRGKLNERNVAWNSFNVYITNTNTDILSAERVHHIYSLRWQIELMFKIWKSIFKINNVKKLKIERFKCFLYGRLIALLLSSIIVFTGKNILDMEKSIEISEIKSFGIVSEYFPIVRVDFFKGELAIIRLLNRIIFSIKKLGIKSNRKGRKSVKEILDFIKIPINELESMVI